jgi:hypothetical protein
MISLSLRVARRLRRSAWALALFLPVLSLTAALDPGLFSHRQEIEITTAGPAKFDLSMELLDRLQPSFADLRMIDAQGIEQPCIPVLPTAPRVYSRLADALDTRLEEKRTIVTFRCPGEGRVEALELRSSTSNYNKSVLIERSEDGIQWKTVRDAQPLHPSEAFGGHARLAIPYGYYSWLRLTLNDQQSPAIPILQLLVLGTELELTPAVFLESTLVSRKEAASETRLLVRLPSRNLFISRILVTVIDPVFQRPIRVAQFNPETSGSREIIVHRGELERSWVIDPYKAPVSLPVERLLTTREFELVIENKDSPPLVIDRVELMCRPVRAIVSPKAPGKFFLLAGSPQALAPAYDLGALVDQLRKAPPAAVRLSSLESNPAHRHLETIKAPKDGWLFWSALALVLVGLFFVISRILPKPPAA